MRAFGIVVAIILAGVLGWIAARATLTSSQADAETPRKHVVSTVSEQTVGKSMNYSATASLPTVPVFYNGLSGTITTISKSEKFSEGDVVYAVNGIPVRVIDTGVVFHRDLGTGARGKDVEAVQSALKRLGHFAGNADGVWGPGTTAAMKAWQRELGIAASGSVQFGELAGIKKLPAVLRVSDEMARGKPIAAGDVAISAAAGERVFYLALNAEQARLIPSDATVDVIGGKETWPAVISSVEEMPDSSVRLYLEHASGGPVCHDACGDLSGAANVTFRSVQHIIPKITGPGVPTVAVRTDESGQTYVLREDGTHTPVEVLGSGNGFTIVNGVTAGQTVVAVEQDAPAAPKDPSKDSVEGDQDQ